MFRTTTLRALIVRSAHGGKSLAVFFFKKQIESLEVQVDYFLNGFSVKTIVLVQGGPGSS